MNNDERDFLQKLNTAIAILADLSKCPVAMGYETSNAVFHAESQLRAERASRFSKYVDWDALAKLKKI